MCAAPVLVRNQVQTADLSQNTVYIKIHYGKIGNSRKVGASEFEVSPVDITAENGKGKVDKKLLRLTKTLLDSKELEDIKRFDNETREFLRLKCHPFDKGIHFVPILALETVENELRRRESEREPLVQKFLDAYPRLCQESARRETFYNPSDYPPLDYVASRFVMSWQYIEIGVPGLLREVSARIFTEERTKTAKILSDAATEIQQLMRVSLCQMVERLQNALTPSGDGKRKRLYETAVTNLTQFLADFDMRNVTNDAQLQQVVEQARGLLRGTNIDELRSTDTARLRVQHGMSDIATRLESMIEDAPTRRIFITEDN